MVESAKKNLATFIANHKGFLKGRKLSEEHKKNISKAKKKLWAEMSEEKRREKREQLRPFFSASPMNKKGRPPTMRIVKRDELGRIVEAIAISR